jgi:hypothetical protein
LTVYKEVESPTQIVQNILKILPKKVNLVSIFFIFEYKIKLASSSALAAFQRLTSHVWLVATIITLDRQGQKVEAPRNIQKYLVESRRM